jgi:hypothetical protein
MKLLRQILSIVCILTAPITRAVDPELTAKDLSQFTPISEGIRRASSLTLYEGLPHQSIEAAQLKVELATKKTIQLHGFPFYERALPVAAEEIEPLRRLSASADSFSHYDGPKKCGGYHPDYALAWKDGGTIHHLLICFGCHEMKLYGPRHELITDIRDDAYKQFETLLRKYRDQRPKRE